VGGEQVTSGSDPARRLLLLDTHVLIWLTDGDRQLGAQAKEALRLAYREDRALISAITPWEIALLVRKGRLKLGRDVLDWVHTALDVPGVHLAALELEIAVESTRLPWEAHGDPADRILVATARHLGATLVTADGALLEFAKQGHFVGMDAGA
jgi:PIN domain nuclease of toxin-antitoxin system